MPLLERKLRCVEVGRHSHLLVKALDDQDPTPCHRFDRLPWHAVPFDGSVLDVDCVGCLSWLAGQRDQSARHATQNPKP